MPSLQRESICNACGYWLTQLMWYFLRGYHDNSSSILSPIRRYVASVNNIFKPREPSSTAIQFSSRFDYNPIIGKRASIPQNGHVLRAPICNCQLCLLRRCGGSFHCRIQSGGGSTHPTIVRVRVLHVPTWFSLSIRKIAAVAVSAIITGIPNGTFL